MVQPVAGGRCHTRPYSAAAGRGGSTLLYLHRAARAADLADDLARLLADDPPTDPFAPEVVSVPSRGIERWLAQELSLRTGDRDGDRRDGVCANVVFPFPATVLGWILDGVLDGRVVRPHETRPTQDPWQPQRLAWTLLDVVADAASAPDLGAFGAHITGERGRPRRLAALHHAADLFDRYGVHRPSMVRAWAQGDDVDATGAPLPDTARWQPTLWRAARDRIGPSFAERVQQACTRLLDGATVPGLPDRLVLHGLTALPATYLEVLDAAARATDIHLFLLHPSPGLWRRLQERPELLAAGTDLPTRRDDPTADVPRHPLLASWARDSRELQLVLSSLGATEPDEVHPGDADDADVPAGAPAPTLLARLQADLLADRPPVGEPLDQRAPDHRHALAVAPTGDGTRRAVDDSLQVHACHGRLRQVEVLRDVVLGLLSDDPTLQPRDIVVLCPDVESFAPLVEAVFGADDRAGGPDEDADATDGSARLPGVRVRLADRSLRRSNPLLRTLGDLLELPDSRLAVATVVDLLHRSPVRARFALTDRDVEAIETWVADLAVRWGLDGDHRRDHGVPTDLGTWRAGLDRLLLGVAVAPDGPRLVDGVLPHDDVEGSLVDLAGRLAELVDRVELVVRGLAAPRPLDQWCDDLATATSLLCRAEGDDEWQRDQLDRLLDDLRRRPADEVEAGTTAAIGLPELRSLLEDALRGRPTRANHRSGDLTVCTLVPMRSVPHRVVCLLGLDDETFPRNPVASGDDLIARTPLVGDRDPRTEDRQLLLDAVLAATEHLVITHRARDERTNAPVPPAVPVAELLDVLDQTATPADGVGLARDVVVRAHPLRAADPRNFRADDPFGFDPVALAGARAQAAPRTVVAPFLEQLPPPGPAPEVVEWDDLVSFLQNPLKHWLRSRLGVWLGGDAEGADDLLPLQLGPLQEWQVGTRLLGGALRDELDAWAAAEPSHGLLPIGRLGERAVDGVLTDVRAVAEAARRHAGPSLDTPGRLLELDLRIDGVHLVGAVAGLHERDGRRHLLTRHDFGRPKPKRTLAAWLPWVAANAAGVATDMVQVTRAKSRDDLVQFTSFEHDLSPTDAVERLRTLLGLYRTGLQAPLPIFSETSGTWARALRSDGDRDKAAKAAARCWQATAWGREYGEGLEPETLRVLGRLAFDELLAVPATGDEDGPGWDTDEPSRFGRLARRLWDPVLDDCTTTTVPRDEPVGAGGGR